MTIQSFIIENFGMLVLGQKISKVWFNEKMSNINMYVKKNCLAWILIPIQGIVHIFWNIFLYTKKTNIRYNDDINRIYLVIENSGEL